MNRETYIRKVKKQLDCSVKEKEEIVRDLQEIFDSGKEHGKSESQIIKQLGKPQAYAQALGCGRQTMPLSGKRKVAVVFLAVGGLFCLYALGESLRFRMPKNAIGGGDAMTMIVLQNSSPVNSSEIFGGLAVICMVSSYAKDPSKSKVVLTFKKDQTYRCKNLENKKIWKGTYTLSRTKSKDTYMLHLVPDQGTASYYGVYGTREYEDGTGHMSVILTTKDKILSFLAE